MPVFPVNKRVIYLSCLMLMLSACKEPPPKAVFVSNPPQGAQQTELDCTLLQNRANPQCQVAGNTIDCTLEQNKTNAQCITTGTSTLDCTLAQNRSDARCIATGTGAAVDCTLIANQNDSHCTANPVTPVVGSTGTEAPPIKTINFTGQTIYGVYDRGSEHFISCSPDNNYNQPGASCNGWLMEAVDVYTYPPAGDFYVNTYGAAKIIIRLSPQKFHDSSLAGLSKEDFCSRAKAYASGTRGISVWVVGNEPNINGMSSTSYAALFNECYRQLKDVSGIVVPAGIAPWDSNEGSSDGYFASMLAAIENLDGIAVHSKTRCNNNSCFDEFDFRKFTAKIPAKFFGRPVFITEANPHDQRWGGSEGWIDKAYELVNAYNHEAVNNKIHALVLFRWDNLNGVQEDSQWEFYMMDSIKKQFWESWKKGYKP